MAKKDYYDVLGITKNASTDDIKKAYRRLAKKYHPDVSKEKDAESKFKEVQEAYDILNDSSKKAQYDRYGHASTGADPFGGGGTGGFGGFEDIISQFFGGGGSGRSTRQTSNVGEDINMRMTIDFMEAVLGTTKNVSVDVTDDCGHCHGSGAESSKDIHTCTKCHGQGYINVDQRTMFGTMRSQQACPQCQGEGQTIDNKCHICSGAGRVKSKKTVDVKVPAGVDNEMTLRVPGYGNGGRKGAESGDLYITFRVKPHKVFKRQGADIILEVPITFTQAALGDKIDIPTIHGEVELTLPAGIQSGTQLKMKNKGTKDPRSGKTGDQNIIVNIETPKNLSNEEKSLFEQLSKLDSPRKKNGWEKFKSFFKN